MAMGNDSLRWAALLLCGALLCAGCDTLKERIAPANDRASADESSDEEDSSDVEEEEEEEESDEKVDKKKKSKTKSKKKASKDDEEEDEEDSDEDEPIDVESSDDDKPGAAAKVDYLVDPTDVFAVYDKALGGSVIALELGIYPTYAFLKAQDPKKKKNVDQFDLRDGVVSDPTPVRLLGGGEKDLESNLFPLAEVDPKGLKSALADALGRTKDIEDGKITHVIVKRRLPFAKDVRCLIYVSGPRESVFLEYDAKGKFLKKNG